MLNRCEFIGNLGADPEVRTTQSGTKIVNFRLAVSEKFKDKNTGERREKTEWVPVTIFAEHLARIAEQYLRKGSKVYVSGQFRTRKWQDQAGQDRYSTEVVLQPYRGEIELLDSRNQGGQGSYDQSPQGYGGGQSDDSGYGGGGRPSSYDMDDEIPFFAEWRA